MTPEERHRGAFEEFDELLREGSTVLEAIKTAAHNNELEPEKFRAFALRQLGDLERYREKMMFRADHDRLVTFAREEIGKCVRRESAYKSVGLLFVRADEAIAECVENRLGRALTENETWMIEDMWDEVFFTGPGGLGSAMKRSRDWRRSQT